MKREGLLLPRIPVSTYRVQMNRNFRFTDAGKILRYLHDLGVSDIYTSPYFKAKEGSLHGYDIVDPGTLNPEIGTEEEHNAFTEELMRYGMGHILDIVPNHMCIAGKDNAWWMDVLENGRSSVYAEYFDIDWDPLKAELKDKILMPVLGDRYGNVLENQELRLSFEEGAFFIYYYENIFPVRPKTYIYILKHRIESLERLLSSENPHYSELLSIITALENLPVYTETDPEKVEVRYREKEIAKKRLWNLYRNSRDIRSFIDRNVDLFNGTKGDLESFDLIERLLNEQAYRLSYWRVATEEINYRRFFDINDLAAICMERPAVFEETHKLVFSLVQERKVTGLRVDHPDGLYHPSAYFHLLQKNIFLRLRLRHVEVLKSSIPSDVLESVKEDIPIYSEESDITPEILKQYDETVLSDPSYKPFYIVGEKILIKDEKMPEDWPIFSTTGYVFLNALNGIFVKTANARAFDEIYERFTKSKVDFQDIVYEKKKLIMKVAMSSEINTLGHYLNRLSEKNRHTRDFTLNSLTTAMVEFIAFLPVYRTYIDQAGVNDRDRRCIELAIAKAKRRNPAVSGSVFDFMKDVLLLSYPEKFGDKDRKEWLDFVMRLQQLTGPIMAKGVEDTTFYVYNRLVSLNEVGGSPDRFGTSLETFHGKNIERMKFWPHALITTSTHDTKRSEDVRARINVLSEIPDEWRKHLVNWRKLNRKKKPVIEGEKVPDLNEEFLLYQTLIGVWPFEIKDETEYENFKGRISDYMLKAVREAKVNTSWVNPNSMYEDALMMFIDGIMNDKTESPFLKDFTSFQNKISHYGLYNSLSQTLLKITSPGVPDFYQGTEIWDFRLVDPDNRRPVDYNLRMKIYEDLKKRETGTPLHKFAREMTMNKENGMIKLYLIYKSLRYRNENRELFERGEYLPLEVMGEKTDYVCAFARRIGADSTIIAAARFFTSLIPEPQSLPMGEEVWGDSSLIVPIAEPHAGYRNVFTDEIIAAKNYEDATVLRLSEVFANFPVAMLERVY